MNKAILAGIKFSPVSLEDALETVVQHIRKGEGDYFCLVNAHLLTEAQRNHELKNFLNFSTGNFPDGMSIAWALKILGNRFKGRVRGKDLMLRLCDYASKNNLKIFLYGNKEETLKLLEKNLKEKYEGIYICGYFSPPFRELTDTEDREIVEMINKSEPDIIFVSLGAPKQEKWMATHKGMIRASQLGVGAAFNFITGNLREAPIWMQKAGLEWLFRFLQEPKRLWRRYLIGNTIFIWLVLKDLIRKLVLKKFI